MMHGTMNGKNVNKEEDVGSYWITLRKGEDTLILKEEALDRTM
jgi:hypothetical protein